MHLKWLDIIEIEKLTDAEKQVLGTEKPSELERENWDVTNMSTEEKLPLSRSVDINCTKCGSLVKPPEYIDIHDVLHFVCDSCGYEWVE